MESPILKLETATINIVHIIYGHRFSPKLLNVDFKPLHFSVLQFIYIDVYKRKDISYFWFWNKKKVCIFAKWSVFIHYVIVNISHHCILLHSIQTTKKKKHTQKNPQTINKPKQMGNKYKTPYVPLFWFDERTFYILMSPLRFRMLTLFCLALWFFSRIFQDFW